LRQLGFLLGSEEYFHGAYGTSNLPAWQGRPSREYVRTHRVSWRARGLAAREHEGFAAIL
jgi:hypothetical protein